MIRRASVKDIKDLVSMRMALIKAANDLGKEVNLTQLEGNIKKYIEEELDKGFLVWVVEEEGNIIGTIGLNVFSKPPTYINPTGKEAFIMNVYVLPSCRGKGYATSLVKEVLHYCKEVGCSKAMIVATEDGRPVYAKIGFKAKESVMEYTFILK